MEKLSGECLDYKDGVLHMEDVSLAEAARVYGTPLYVYSTEAFLSRTAALKKAFANVCATIFYSVKSCSNLSVLRLLHEADTGFDIVSGGELARLKAAGIAPKQVVFAGVGKTNDDMCAALKTGILFFTVESEAELTALSKAGRETGIPAPFALRINPDVAPDTHNYITTGKKETKFGIHFARARELYKKAQADPYLNPRAIQAHIGSQILSADPYRELMEKMADYCGTLEKDGIRMSYADIGGGFGIQYKHQDRPLDLNAVAAAVEQFHAAFPSIKIGIEPGRFISGNSGVLLTRVMYLKETPVKKFIIVDAGMHTLARPSLYGSHHEITPVKQQARSAITADTVGPLCESGDFLAKDRDIARPFQGDILAVRSAGAYGMAMASQYNSHPRPAEVLVKGNTHKLIRKRETFDDLWEGEL